MYPSIFRPKRQSDYILYKLNRRGRVWGVLFIRFSWIFWDLNRRGTVTNLILFAHFVWGEQFSGGVAARIALFGSASCCCLHVSPVSRKHAYRDHAPGIYRNRLLIICWPVTVWCYLWRLTYIKAYNIFRFFLIRIYSKGLQ